MQKNIIYLNGFMGSGKSTIGPILANTLGWDFFDLDKEVEKQLQTNILEIFMQKGEEYFREKECEILKKLSERDNVIISLGGGTAAYKDNIEFLRSTGKVIYIKVSEEVLYNRLKNKGDRPVLNNKDGSVDKENLRNRISELLKVRTPFYEQADLVIDMENQPLGLVIDKIAKIIYRSNLIK